MVKSDSQIDHFQFFKVLTNKGAWKSLESEPILRSRTKRYSEWTALSRIVLRAAHSAPTQFIAELKRSADYSELYSIGFSFQNCIRLVSVFVKFFARVCDFGYLKPSFAFRNCFFWSRDFFPTANLTPKKIFLRQVVAAKRQKFIKKT
jgi:hypothetical protein